VAKKNKSKNNFILILLIIIAILLFSSKQLEVDGNGNDSGGDNNAAVNGGGGNGGGGGGGTPTAPTPAPSLDCNAVCIRLPHPETGIYFTSGRKITPIDLISCEGAGEWKIQSSGEWCCCSYYVAPPPSDIGCTDNDNTQTDFDNSLKTSSSCVDKLGTHYDNCEEGLLKEWHCPASNLITDVCQETFYNCQNMLGDDYVCGWQKKSCQNVI